VCVCVCVCECVCVWGGGGVGGGRGGGCGVGLVVWWEVRGGGCVGGGVGHMETDCVCGGVVIDIMRKKKRGRGGEGVDVARGRYRVDKEK